MNKTTLEQHLEKLRVFSTVVRLQTMTQAAHKLHMTQAAVSKSIHALEEALNVKLLDRGPSGVTPTSKGRALFELSKRITHELEVFEERMVSGGIRETVNLRVATHETLAVHIFPQLLESFTKLYPHIHFALTCARIDSIIDGLRRQEFDLGLSVEPFAADDLEVHPVYEGDMCFLVTGRKQNCPALLRDKSVFSIEELKNIPMITDAQAHMRQGLSMPKWLLTCGFSLDNFYELNSFEAALKFCENGIGVAVAPDRNAKQALARKELRLIKIKEIDEKKLTHYRICVSFRKNNSRRAAIMSGIQWLQKNV